MKTVSTLLKLATILLLFILKINAQNLNWINYTNGNIVTAIAQEGDYLWVGSAGGGLVRFNKTDQSVVYYNKANSGIPDNYISSIIIDHNGNKWLGTYCLEGSYNGQRIYNSLVKFGGTKWTVF